MFTIEQIKEAHSKVKSGADFPRYIQELKVLGVISYDNYVADGTTRYFGPDSYLVTGEAKYLKLNVADSPSKYNLAKALKIHQAGGTDYPTFCKQAAQYGIEKWKVDLGKMTCTYYDVSGNIVIDEDIPA